MFRIRAFAAPAIALVLIAGCTPSRPPYPPTEKKPVTDNYHSVNVVDQYRWLDDKNDTTVRSWVAAQNTFSRSLLDRVSARGAIATRLKELYGQKSISYGAQYYRGKLFVTKYQPPKEQPFLVVFDSPDDLPSERIVLDPNVLDTSGTTSIDFYVPSRDGKYIAMSLSRGGSEDGTASVFETATGRKLDEVVPRVNYPTAGGSIAWNGNASGFYYTRYPQGSERPAGDMNFYQQVYFHKLGTTPAHDRYVTGKFFPRIAEISLSTSDDGRYLLARVANGDGGEFAFYLMGPGERWTRIAEFSDGIKKAAFGMDAKIYLLSNKDAPRGRILTVPLARPQIASAVTLVPESDAVITSLLPTGDRLYVVDLVGGPSRVRVFDLKGAFRAMLPTAPVATVSGLICMKGNEVLYGTETYLENFAYFRYDPESNGAARTRLANSSSVDFNDCEVVREFATSKDGTKIPMAILRRKGTAADGRSPLILYGYGGFAVPEVPSFSVRNRLWLDQGGIYVDANLRGGGEFGEGWHDGGRLTKKQNVFDDFIACAEYVIGKHYTSPSRLAIEGGSNGGLLMGAALTQRPDLFRAVVSHVGLYDMLRVELFPNGAFNVTEFGTVKDPEQFRALYAYSPYHHVGDGTKYPAVLMLTGDNDGRVDPANSRKMTARLQAATGSPFPVLLRTSPASGHGFGSSLDEVIAQDTDVFAFLFDQLQVQFTLRERY
jgi:prolyl oligopeptidase